jgi:PAS domain S-box-containing protein
MAIMEIEGREDIRAHRTMGCTRSAIAYGTADCEVRRAKSSPQTTRLSGIQGTLEFDSNSHFRLPTDSEKPQIRLTAEQQYQTIVETMPDGALILSPTGILLYSNRGFSRMMGIPIDELVGSSFIRLVAQEYRETFEAMFAGEKDAVGQAELALLSGSGARVVVSLSGSQQVIDDDPRVCVMVADITTRVQTENDLKQAKEGLERAVETLQESRAEYLDLYENANVIIFTLDLEGRLTSANRTTYRELGFDYEEIIGRNFFDLLTPDSGRFASFLTARALPDKQSPIEEQPWEFEAVTKAGPIIHLEVRTRLIWKKETAVGIQCIAQNITERKQVEMELTRLAAAIEQAVESVIILDKSGKIQYANRAFFGISGYSKEEVLGKSPAFLKNGERDGETFYRGLLNTLTTKSVWTGRISNRNKDGTAYEAETTISPVRDKSGKIVNYVAVERDVTEVVRLEGQLRQMQKMEAIGTLAGGIAHDFNNILSAIIGFSEMSIEDIDEGHPAKNYASQILKAAIRGRDLVRQILMFSHKNEEERKHIKLSAIVREAMKFLRPSLPSTIEIRERIESESGVVFASPTQIHQVLMGLCTNAGHAMRIKGGVLEIGLSEFDIDSAGDVPYLGMEPGFYLKISVSDTGVGIDRTIQERIFDPFFTTKSPSEGTGMGLAVVHGIVKSHGGAITVRSTPGRGSVFDVYFPRVDVMDAEETEGPTSSQRGSERILLVDDEAAIVETSRSILKRLGYEVTVVGDSLEALETFRRDPSAFDLIITDHTMPHMTGTELAQELMSVRPGIPIILCTGYSEMINRELAKDLGIREFVMKPVSRNELADTIRRVLADGSGAC